MNFTTRRLVGLGCALVLAVGAMQACSAGGDDDNKSSGTTNGSGTSQGGAGGSSGVGGDLSGVGGSTNSAGGSGGDCAAVSSEATAELAPADIIIAVDTSGSMNLEAGWTQNEMNNMVSAIVNSGIDAHVVMISSDDICVPAPLGSGNCPADENLPSFRHVQVGVGSNDALSKILNTYDMGSNQWKDSLRANATKTFVVISDDDSNMNASTFTSAVNALDPSFQGFKFDAIVSNSEGGVLCCLNSCACCGIAADEGKVYKDLVTQTGGVFGDLCGQNFGPVFQDIATAIVMGSQISCEYDIPPPQMGTIDYDRVNVEFVPSPNAMPQPIYNVPGGAMDCGPQGGWYYDDPMMPTKILLCPATCTAVQGSTEGAVNVLFGCETLVGPPN